MNTSEDKIIAWLLGGDVSIQYQVHRDLLGVEKPELRERIAREGWGARFLSYRKPRGIGATASTSPSGFPRTTPCSI